MNCELLSGVAGTVELILKQGSCTQEGYVNVKQLSALEGQPDTGLHFITMSCTACAAIYSNMTHFHVGHFDDVIACSNGHTVDGKSTRS